MMTPEKGFAAHAPIGGKLSQPAKLKEHRRAKMSIQPKTECQTCAREYEAIRMVAAREKIARRSGMAVLLWVGSGIATFFSYAWWDWQGWNLGVLLALLGFFVWINRKS